MAVSLGALGGAAAVGEVDRGALAIQTGRGLDGDRLHAGAAQTFDKRIDHTRATGVAQRRGLGACRFGLRRGRGDFVAIAIETTPRLAAQETGADQFLLQDRGREARVVVVGGKHRVGDREVDVVADQVHQLERTHAESAAVTQHGVQRCHIGGLLKQQAQGFGVVRPGDAIDDEAGRRFRVHRALAPAFSGGVDRVRDLAPGRQALDHFDQRHQRHRVKEMHADQAFRVRELRADRRHRDRRGIGGQDAALADDAFEFGEQGALGIQVLDDGLDHEDGAGGFLQRPDRLEALARQVGFDRAHAALLDQFGVGLADAVDGLGGGVRTGIEQQHLVAGGGRDLRDAGAHGAAADDGDRAAREDGVHGHSPLKCGVRLARKAATPSR